MYNYCVTYKSEDMNRSALGYVRANSLEEAWKVAKKTYEGVIDVV